MRGRGLFQGERLVFGNRVVVPTGKPTHIGPRTSRALAEVVDYGEAQTVTLVVGQNKGKEAKNRRGRCARAPGRFNAAEVDRAFAELRGVQLGGKANVAATRVAGRGWYKGSPEQSVSFQVAFAGGSKREPDFATFSENLDSLAEQLAERFCQDEVLILRDDGAKRTAAGARWDAPAGPNRPKKARKARK